jgi:hypothetical protein
MIMRAREHELPWERVQALLDELLVVMRKFDCRRAREILLNTIAEYKPAAEIGDLVWCEHTSQPVAPPAAAALDDRKVTELAVRRAAKATPPAAAPPSN